MIVTIAFHSADADRTTRLLEWIYQLGGCKAHSCLLVADASVTWVQGLQVLEAANAAFRTASYITTDDPVTGWPQGPNALFVKAAQACHGLKQPFLWLESDAIPLCRDWMEQIQKAWNESNKMFLGHVYECAVPSLPKKLMSGVAVYPSDAILMIEDFIKKKPDVAWDVSSANALAGYYQHTDLIHHFNPPKDSPASFPTMMKVEDIRKGAVIFHSNKDETLVRELRGKLKLSEPKNFIVVIPFHNGDSPLTEQLLQWMVALRVPLTHEVLLSYDASTLGMTVKRVEAYAAMCFSRVHKTSYRIPGGIRFPQTAAWQHAALWCEAARRPWMWMEPDCVPLRQDFLTTLQSAYDRGGKPFAGPVVQPVGHVNGTAIYPADTPSYCPRTMSHTNNAWDVEMRDEMINKNTDIRDLWCCRWGVVNGKLNEVEGPSPSFNEGLFRQIPTSAVIYHRCKDGSLFTFLRKRVR